MKVAKGVAALGLAGALTVAGVFGAAPAMADAAGTVKGGSRAVSVDWQRAIISFTCAALADNAATPVAVTQCDLKMDGVWIASAAPASAPGVAVATTNYKIVDAVSEFEVCWTVSATFAVDNSVATDSGCGPGFLETPEE